MKNITKIMGITVMIAVMLFVMAACSGGGGGEGGVNAAANVRAYDNGGIAPPQSPAMPNARPSMNKAPRAVDASFNKYTDFYTKLGAHKTDFTPSRFCLTTMINALDSEGNLMNLGMENFDFAKGVTLTIGDIPTGVTCAAITFWFTSYTNAGTLVPSTVEFPWPGGQTAFDSHTKKANYAKDWLSDSNAESWSGNAVTLPFLNFLPYGIKSFFGISSTVDNFTGIAFGAGERRVISGDITCNDIIPGGGANPSAVVVDNGRDALIVPFTPVNIPAGASSVTLHISWNLNKIISQYEGAGGGADDDIFVLKEDWWDGLYLYADAQ